MLRPPQYKCSRWIRINGLRFCIHPANLQTFPRVFQYHTNLAVGSESTVYDSVYTLHILFFVLALCFLRLLLSLLFFFYSNGERERVREMGGREDGEEGVMATDFFWSYTDEPHASRRRQILSQYPKIKELFGPDPWAFLKITIAVLLQLWTATFLCNAGWLKILTVAYFFGSILNHNLFLAIHELSHNLAFSTPVYNRWLGIFANLPVGVPMSVTFQKYHLEHHRFQGVDGIDMDIPCHTEGHVVTNSITKAIWVVLQLFFYALRPLFLNPKPPGLWEFTNLIIQLSLDAAMVYFWGWKSLAYLILSTFVGGGMHPMAGHFISEHYVFHPDQETYSYYGPLNLLTWSVGYHNEHHDFPRIPGSKLYKVKEIAPEFYNDFESYKSWSQVIYMYIMDRTVGPFSRMKRKSSKNGANRKVD